MKSHYATVSLVFGVAIALTFVLPEPSESDPAVSVARESAADSASAIPLEIGPRLAKVEPSSLVSAEIEPIALPSGAELAIESPAFPDASAMPEAVPQETLDVPDSLPVPPAPTSLSETPVEGVADRSDAPPAASYDAPNDTPSHASFIERGEWLTYLVQPGDSMSSIFSRHDFDAGLLQRFIEADGEEKTLHRLRPGQELQFYITESGSLPSKLWIRVSPTKSVRLSVSEAGVSKDVVEMDVETRVESVQGRITESLYADAKAMGLTDKMIMDLAKIYAFDLDFARQIRPNDRFSVIFEADYLDGERVGVGRILAAEFVNRGEVMAAIGFESDGLLDYYDEQGRSRKKAFVRTPLNFRRISSVFSDARMHPILERSRPHRGVDYAADKGTPVWATGKGVVERKHYHRGYGNVIHLQHGERYTTVYAHLSRFKKGLKVGDSVAQGEIIGYVGSTGLSTGPHLHYEFRVDDKHVDPLSLTLPAADPLSGKELARFRAVSRPMLARLDRLREVVIAQQDLDQSNASIPN